jgi:hypothetical protein
MSRCNKKRQSLAVSFASRCAIDALEQRVHLSYDSRGKVSVIVEGGVAPALTVELNQLQNDLIADGWTVSMHTTAPLMKDNDNVWRNNVEPAVAVTTTTTQYRTDLQTVKDMLVGQNGDFANGVPPGKLGAVLIIGHVTVPYSGITSYDTHGGRAMPTDQYYADLDATPLTWGDYKHDVFSWPGTDGGLETFEWTPTGQAMDASMLTPCPATPNSSRSAGPERSILLSIK